MHNKFVERKRKSIINHYQLQLAVKKKLESIHEQSKTNVQHFSRYFDIHQISIYIQQQLLNNWNPVLPSTNFSWCSNL